MKLILARVLFLSVTGLWCNWSAVSYLMPVPPHSSGRNSCLSRVVSMFAFSGASHCPPFTPADKVDEHAVNRACLQSQPAGSWRGFQKGGCSVAGTAGWRRSLWGSPRIFNYQTQHQVLA